MPNRTLTEYMVDFSESGKCAQALDDWFQGEKDNLLHADYLPEQENVEEEKSCEEVTFSVIEQVFQAGKLQELRNSLANIESECQKPGWDGYEAAALSSDALREIRVLLELLPTHLPAPDIMPEPTGAIGLEWRKGKDMILVLSVQGKGVMNYAAILGAETNRYGVEPFSASIPQFIQREIFPHFFETS